MHEVCIPFIALSPFAYHIHIHTNCIIIMPSYKIQIMHTDRMQDYKSIEYKSVCSYKVKCIYRDLITFQQVLVVKYALLCTHT